ncbi:MAG: glycoside hydrolase family 3 protein [Candidatus Izemoplasmataceae bacterium]
MPSNKVKHMIGQMLMFGVKGYTFTEEMRTMIASFDMGGFIYFKRNVQNAKQVFTLNKAIQAYAKTPLFIGIDQEGGLVTAIDDITPTPGAMATAAAKDYLADYKTVTKYAGTALKSLGISINFAPNGDINNNPDNPVINARSYGDTKEMVSLYTTAMIESFESARLISTIKHFPGHGDTNVDSHLGLPTIHLTLEKMDQFELVPFKNAIKNGVPAIMTAHILVPALDAMHPATLSKRILKELCRDQLNFNGLLITDLLSMHAIKDHYSLKDTIMHAVNASNDILLYDAPTLEGYHQFVETFYACVDEDLIKESTIEAAYKRIMHAKETYHVGLMDASFEVIESSLMPNDIKCLSEKITKASMTMVKGTISKIDFKKTLVIFPNISIYSLIDTYHNRQQTFKDYLSDLKIDTAQILLSEHLDEANIQMILKESKNYNHIVVFTYNSFMYPQQQRLMHLLDEVNVIWVSLRAPYDGIHIKKGTYLCAYEATKQSFKAIYETLNGDEANGTLPVKI